MLCPVRSSRSGDTRPGQAGSRGGGGGGGGGDDKEVLPHRDSSPGLLVWVFADAVHSDDYSGPCSCIAGFFHLTHKKFGAGLRVPQERGRGARHL